MEIHNCPQCNKIVESGTRFCQRCGYNLEMGSTQQSICPKCLKSYPSETQFCKFDGYKLTSAEKIIPKCVKCGTSYPAGTQFCSVDGGAVIADAYRSGQRDRNPQNKGFYPKASLGNRFLAYLLDSLIIVGLAMPAMLLFIIGMAQIDNDYVGIFLLAISILLFSIPLIYSFVKDGLGTGQSWGKKAVGLMVVSLPNNTPCSMSTSSLRGLIGVLIGLIPLGWIIEPIMVLATEDGRRLADKTANTQVIEVYKYTRLKL